MIMNPKSRLARSVAGITILALLLSLNPIVAMPARAASPNIVISQVYGGGGNTGAPYTNDYIELFNRGNTTVSLDGWSVQYASATGTGNLGANSAQLTPLSGSLAPGQYLLIQESAGTTGLPLPAPDITDITPINMSATGGKVALANIATSLGCNGGSTPCSAYTLTLIVDLVGWDGANFYEGSGAAPATSNTTALLRNNGGCAETDDNATDFTAGAPSPRNTASPLSLCSADAAPAVLSITPANGATQVAADANIEITFSEPVNVSGAWFALSCTTSGVHTAIVSGGPTTFTLDPETDFTSSETCSFTVYASQVSDQDTDDPPDNMLADFASGFTTVGPVCNLPYTHAYEIQGSGMAAAITGTVTTQGVVVGDYEGASPTLRGFYLQDLTGDGDPATSDGLFVFNGNNDNVSLGQVVRVTGTAAEFQDQTQVSAASIVDCGTTATVTPVDVTLPFPSPDYPERFEGMLVRLPQTLYVTEHFQLGRFGQVVMSSGGRLAQPTNVITPGAPALALQAANDLNRIIVDDALNNQNPDPILFGRGGNPLSASNTLRGGDTATGIVGLMTYTWAGNSASGNAYRVRPVNALGGGVPDFQPANPRPSAAPAVSGTLRVAGMNLLNFFNTFDGLPDTVDNCTLGVGGAPTDCRGADTQAEFDRQWPKTVAAILATQADVIGVNEIENDGYGPTSAIAFLVEQLNTATAPGTYAFVDVDAATGQVNALGTDAIKIGLIYQPAKVTPVGQTAALNTVAFVNGGDSAPRNRPSLAQAFQQNSNGARFIVDLNHLKSKGSACDAPDAGDGQGNCNEVRVRAAQELMAWLATDPTGTGEPDILLLGDYNSYAREDPITVIKSAGFTNLIESFLGAEAYSYVFDGQWGYLDHALGSASIVSQVTGVGDYHINADEPSVLDYNTDFKTPNLQNILYAPDQFRISDHDPVVVGLKLNGAPTVNAGGPYNVSEGDSVAVSAAGSDLDGDPLTYAWDLDYNGTFETPGQSVTFSAAALDGPSARTIVAQVTDSGGLTATAQATVNILNVAPMATFNAASPVNEGSPFNVSLTQPFDPSNADTAAGFSYTFDCGQGYGAPGIINSATCTAVDNPSQTVKGKIADKDGGLTEYVATVTVNNVPPSVGPISAPADPVLVHTSVNATASFTDPGVLDTHTAVWDWGDGTTSAGTVSELNGSGSVSGTHTYAAAGFYTVKLTVTDKDGASAQSVFRYLVVYDPGAGFVTGGGWVDSPADAYPADPALTGKAIFGLLAWYPRGANVPRGQTGFYLHAARLNLHSTSYQWLVIAGSKAQYQGSGKINGSGEYGFLVTVTDGKVRGRGEDMLRIKIWDKATGTVIYDTQMGAPDDADATSVVKGGSILIHK
jgi:predicted extracellular nuclease